MKHSPKTYLRLKKSFIGPVCLLSTLLLKGLNVSDSHKASVLECLNLICKLSAISISGIRAIPRPLFMILKITRRVSFACDVGGTKGP